MSIFTGPDLFISFYISKGSQIFSSLNKNNSLSLWCKTIYNSLHAVTIFSFTTTAPSSSLLGLLSLRHISHLLPFIILSSYFKTFPYFSAQFLLCFEHPLSFPTPSMNTSLTILNFKLLLCPVFDFVISVYLLQLKDVQKNLPGSEFLCILPYTC